jgi:hypothetical protein
MSATRFLQLLIWLLNASFLVKGYHIGPSCSHYGDDEVDLTEMVKEAMEEAFDMKGSAEYAIERDTDPHDNSRAELFRKANYDDYRQIKSKSGKISKVRRETVTLMLNNV